MAQQQIYMDSKTMTITTTNPISDGDRRVLVDLTVPEGVSIPEGMGVLDGWLRSFKGFTADQRNTVARVTIG